MTEIRFDPELIRRYDRAGPRYTSYPTAVQFNTQFGADDYQSQVAASNASGRPLSLYFHLPFCDTVCFYCACNKIITKNRKRAHPYLQGLHQEIAMQGALFDSSREVHQLHWGGGTPTFISHEQMRDLMAVTRRHFKLLDKDQGEYSIEIDPREAGAETIGLLRELGFNRMSLGVQDFNPQVQVAVNRIQSYAQTAEVVEAARRVGFKSISFDLIYGLPHQSVGTFADTLETVIAMEPDRLSVFNYAHLPQLFKTQRQINAEDLPAPEEKLAILQMCIERLTEAGYIYIGMDHFARPEDELARAQRAGTLYRNFQGYSTHSDCDLIGMGVTSIGSVNNSYSQNLKTLEDYSAALEQSRLPVWRGLVLSEDDKRRRDLITRLICHFQLDIGDYQRAHRIDFKRYYAAELADLKAMQADGLLEVDDRHITVKPAGKLLIRNICMIFDRYLREAAQPGQFSKVI